MLPADVKLYAGGEDNFCHRVQATGTPGEFSDFGYLDRRALAARKVGVVLCEQPTVIGGHAFTSGQIKRRTDEKILPNTLKKVELPIRFALSPLSQKVPLTARTQPGRPTALIDPSQCA